MTKKMHQNYYLNQICKGLVRRTGKTLSGSRSSLRRMAHFPPSVLAAPQRSTTMTRRTRRFKRRWRKTKTTTRSGMAIRRKARNTGVRRACSKREAIRLSSRDKWVRTWIRYRRGRGPKKMPRGRSKMTRLSYRRPSRPTTWSLTTTP